MKFQDFEGENTTMVSAAGYKIYPFGWDFGNAEMCAALMKGNQPILHSAPTAFAKVDVGRLTSLGVETKDALVVRFADEAAQWGIGPVALAQAAEPWSGRGDILRYASKHSLRALLGMSATMTSDKEYGLMVASGLPAEPFQKHAALKKEIKKLLTGTYTFTLDGKTMRTCHLEYATTLMEGAGALTAYAKKENIAPAGAAVIDVGGRTTDLYVARGGVPIAAFCVGKPLGVATAATMLEAAFDEKYGFPLNPIETRSILFAYANSEGLKRKQYPEISKYGEKILPSELDHLAQEAVLETTNEIVSFVSSAWRESDASLAVGVRFDPVIGIGGGMYYFYDALKQRIPHLQKPENPVFANAYGYARAAAFALDKKLKKEAEEAAEAALAQAAATQHDAS